jgi:putative chitinase
MIREAAYMLATVKGEAGNFQPIKEIHANPAKQPDLWRTQQRYWPTGFYGRGYVQLTHEANYRSAGQKLAGTVIVLANQDKSERTITVDAETFVKEPNLVMQPSVAYLILSRGMHEGWFRKRKSNGVPYKLSDFIKEGKPPDYLGARNIINHPSSGAAKFAGFAEKFELILRAAYSDD